MLAHNVYFTLKDPSENAVDTLVGECKKYLTDHPGIVSFAVGRLALGYERPVNVRDFHVALQIIFQDRADHDAYQVADSHQQFVDRNKDNWQLVRVFDVDLLSD
jgi:hypothetical protein